MVLLLLKESKEKLLDFAGDREGKLENSRHFCSLRIGCRFFERENPLKIGGFL